MRIPLLQRCYRMAYPVLRPCIQAVGWTWLTIEYIALALPHARSIRNADFIYPLWFWSFGHQATDPHMLSLNYRGKKLLILISDYDNFNRPIVRSCAKDAKTVELHHSRVLAFFRTELGTWPMVFWKRRLLRGMVRCLGGHATVVEEYYRTTAPRIAGIYLTEYMHLLETLPEPFAVPDPQIVARVRTALGANHPLLTAPFFVAIYLRHKRPGITDIRDTVPSTYRDAVQAIRARGGIVLCGGDFGPDDICPNDDGVLGYDDLPISRQLFDFYALSQCTFLIGAHSGPLPICTAFNRPVLVTNNAFYYLSGYLPTHRLLSKRLLDQSGRELTVRELFSMPIVAYCDRTHFAEAGLRHIDNTPEELRAATEEMLALLIDGRDIATEEDRHLLERFRSLLPPGSVVRESPCRPAVCYLHMLQWEKGFGSMDVQKR